jgi:hypothetical protein
MKSLSELDCRPIIGNTDPARFTAHCLDEPGALPEGIRQAAQRTVCGRARDADDARLLLQVLGLLEPAGSPERSSSAQAPVAQASPDAA